MKDNTVNAIASVDLLRDPHGPETIERLVRDTFEDTAKQLSLEAELLHGVRKTDAPQRLALLYALAVVGWIVGRLDYATLNDLLRIAANSEEEVEVRDAALWSCMYPGEKYERGELQELIRRADQLVNDSPANCWSKSTLSAIEHVRRELAERAKSEGDSMKRGL